jgi:hypothetical protein
MNRKVLALALLSLWLLWAILLVPSVFLCNGSIEFSFPVVAKQIMNEGRREEMQCFSLRVTGHLSSSH